MSAPKMFAHHWIGGEWVDSDKRRESINPATGETIGTYTEAGEAEATRAIAAALKAFRETDWRKNRPLRAKVLNYMADRFEARADDLIEILTLENGKVKPEAQFELSMVPSRLRFICRAGPRGFRACNGDLAGTLCDHAARGGRRRRHHCAVELAGRAVRPIVAPALAAGCTTVGELPGFTAQTNARMCEVLSEVASLTDGGGEHLHRGRRRAARTMIDSPDVPVISFTGSSGTGRAIMAACAKNMKRFGGELGGKTPVLLFDDATWTKRCPKSRRRSPSSPDSSA
jgi:betaine-aldehyde dehydrogenase